MGDFTLASQVNLGPLHMIPVDWDGPVTEISLDSYFLVKNLMCSYEKAGQPGYRDLGFYDRDLGNRDENFSI